MSDFEIMTLPSPMEDAEDDVREIDMSDLSSATSRNLFPADQPYDYCILRCDEIRLLELSPKLDIEDEQVPVSGRLNHYPIEGLKLKLPMRLLPTPGELNRQTSSSTSMVVFSK
jgi:hypothetical protein